MEAIIPLISQPGKILTMKESESYNFQKIISLYHDIDVCIAGTLQLGHVDYHSDTLSQMEELRNNEDIFDNARFLDNDGFYHDIRFHNDIYPHWGLSTSINECILRGNKWIVLDLSLQEYKNRKFEIGPKGVIISHDNVGHANIIIINTINMEIERFEPWGPKGPFESFDIDEKVKDILIRMYPKFKYYNYFKPTDYCLHGPQTMIKYSSNYRNDEINKIYQGGWCGWFVLYYFTFRLLNENIRRDEIVKLLYYLNPDILYDLIRKFRSDLLKGEIPHPDYSTYSILI